jgi:hypothetical protein
MDYKKVKLIIIKIIISVSLIVLFCGCLLSYDNPLVYYNPLIYWNPYNPDFYERIFRKEIKKDKRFEELLYFKGVPYAISDNVFEIVIKLKDDRIIGGEVRYHIYNFRRLTVIDNYRLNILYLDNDGIENTGRDGIYHNDYISRALLDRILHKPPGYFGTDLNIFIDCYDEIKDFFEKVYNEGRIPGGEEDKGPDISKWGDEEVLKKYTGYIIIDETDRVKIYVDYIGSNYNIERGRVLY